MTNRREYLRAAGTLAVGSLVAGCTGGQNGDQPNDDQSDTESSPTTEAQTTTAGSSVTNVAVGPEKRLRFEPEEIEISVGDTVAWEAMSTGHNVTSDKGASSKCKNPEGAEPFKSYEGDEHFSVMEVGDVFEHEFTVAGEYVYVCAPHAGQGMVGTVVVTE